MQHILCKRIHFETIESTHLYAYAMPCNSHFTIVTAKHQTNGVGQYSNTFSDTNGSLLFSCNIPKSLILQPKHLLDPSCLVIHVFQLLIDMLKDMLKDMLDCTANSDRARKSNNIPFNEFSRSNMAKAITIKKPNDLYIFGKKCGGALTVVKENSIILSFGINIESAPSLPENTPYRATYINKYLRVPISIYSTQCMIESAICSIFDIQIFS